MDWHQTGNKNVIDFWVFTRQIIVFSPDFADIKHGIDSSNWVLPFLLIFYQQMSDDH